jgi:hypothetical protein
VQISSHRQSSAWYKSGAKKIIPVLSPQRNNARWRAALLHSSAQKQPKNVS